MPSSAHMKSTSSPVSARSRAGGGDRPRGVHARAERREDDGAPVAQLVEERLDDDALVARQLAGGVGLVGDVADKVLGGAVVEAAFAFEQLAWRRRAARARAAASARRWPGRSRAAGPGRRLSRTASCPARRARAPPARGRGRSPAPATTRRRAGTRRRRAFRTPSPRRARRRAVPGGRRASPARNTPYRPRSGIVPPLSTASRCDAFRGASVPREPIPRDARPQLGELVGRVSARRACRARPRTGCAAGRGTARRRGPWRTARRRSAAPSRPWRRSAGRARRAGCAGSGSIRPRRGACAGSPRCRRADRRGISGKMTPVDGGADVVPRPADALHAGGDRRRGFDLDHQVDGAHVDAELHRRRGDDRRKLAAFEAVFDLDALGPGDRAVVGLGDLFVGELVDRRGEPLGQAAAVDEDHRRAVVRGSARPAAGGSAARSTAWPAPPTWGRTGSRAAGRGGPCPRRASRCARSSRLGSLASMISTGRGRGGDVGPGVGLGAAEQAGDFFERPLRGGEADALHAARAVRCSRLRRRRSSRSSVRNKMRAALRRRDRVDLVDDHRLDVGAGSRATCDVSMQVQRLGRGDEDVRRLADDVAAVGGAGVAGADGDARQGERRRLRARRWPGCRRAARGDCGRRRPRGPSAGRCRGRARRVDACRVSPSPSP